MIVEYIIFVLIFIAAIVTSLIATIGWIRTEFRNVELEDRNEMLLVENSDLKRKKANLRSLAEFYRNQLEEKK